MASIWKDPRTRYWVACFTDRNGRRVKRSTGETLPKKAQKIADEYEKVARTKQTVRTVRSTISSLAQEIWGVAVTTQSLREHIHAWLEEKRSDAAASTIEFYEKSAAKFLGFLGPAADEPIDHLEKDHVRRFKAEISKTLAAKTVNHHLKLLRMVFKAARRDGLIDDDPAEFVDTIKREKRSVRRAFTVEEIGRVLKCCEAEWRSIVICGLYTGQRLADLACLRWSNVDLHKKEITLITRKTDRKLTISIAPALMSHLKTLPVAADRATPLHPQAAAVVGKQGRVGTLSNQFSANPKALQIKSERATRELMKVPDDLVVNVLETVVADGNATAERIIEVRNLLAPKKENKTTKKKANKKSSPKIEAAIKGIGVWAAYLGSCDFTSLPADQRKLLIEWSKKAAEKFNKLNLAA